MTTETVTNLCEKVFQNMRKAGEANLKMQKEMFDQWVTLWPGLPTSQNVWVEKVRDFEKKWLQTVSDLARKHRDVLDRQHQVALESLEEALQITDATNLDEFRQRAEQLCRKSLDCLREVSESQMSEFQEAISKWSELITKGKA